MLLHKSISTTAALEKLALTAASALEIDEKLTTKAASTKEETVVTKYRRTDHIAALVEEYIKSKKEEVESALVLAKIKVPERSPGELRTYPTQISINSGNMSTDKNEMAILIAGGEAKLEIWRGNEKREAQLVQLVPGSSAIIFNEVRFRTIPTIPFILITRPTKSEQEGAGDAA